MHTPFAIPADALHLGGYIPGGDEATYYPELWKELTILARASFAPYPQDVRVLDVGAGDNVATSFFRTLPRVRATGVDGCPGISDVCHDFTRGWLGPLGYFDLVWSCEFVEHVEERYLPFVLDALSRAPLLAMTHANRGQPGHHHVNCKSADYWIGALAGCRMEFSPSLTAWARSLAALNLSPWNHFAQRGLVFERVRGPVNARG